MSAVPVRRRFAPFVSAVLACLGLAVPGQQAHAQQGPSINLNGAPGLIDMPAGGSMADGWMSLTRGQFGPITRNTLSYQITPRLSGSFRYIGIRKWNDRFCPPDCGGANGFEIYYDRNFDLRYQVLKEGRYLPDVTVGLQDFVGTGLAMAEYVAASKSFGPRLRVTAGLGFGRLASHGGRPGPFGERPDVDFGNGGMINGSQWFRGDMAPFGGIEYRFADKWTFKAEYSSDAYTMESGRRRTFDWESPYNFGIEYQRGPHLKMGLYSMHGSQIGFNLSVLLNPDQRPMGGVGGVGPTPVVPRPSKASNPGMYTTAWIQDDSAKTVLIRSLNANLEREKLVVESLGVTGDRAQVRFRNPTYDATSQAVGRVARAMARVLPSSVEIFEIVPQANGLVGAKVTIRRSDLERLEFAPDSGELMRDRAQVATASPQLPGAARNEDLYPRFAWTLQPWAQSMLFNPAEPLQLLLGAQLKARFEPAPGVVLSGSVTQSLTGGFRSSRISATDPSPLPPVRRQSYAYYQGDGPVLETLTASVYHQFAPELYGRVTAGYLERMYGGVAVEALYKPVNRRWAVGAELAYVAQRDTEGLGFGEYDYSVATGHLSGYYDLGNGFEAQLDLGRYLAGDVGGTFTLMRTFENGWKVGAFATLTNVSAEDFGEGSFDKGIRLEIPVSYFIGQPSRGVRTMVLRPLGRDGGARVQINDRLRETLRGYDAAGIDAQWGRFWK